MSGRILFAGTTLGAAAVFTLFPQIDLWVSGLLYRPGAGFYLGSWAAVRIVYHAVPLVTDAIVIFAACCAVALILGRKSLLGCNGRAAAFLVLSLAIGPGIIGNTILKDHWGRARPSQVTEFGGKAGFTPALEPSDQCKRNCSFVSGHAALGFYLVSLAFLVPAPRRRRRAELAALAAGGLIGLVRIAQGGHFLSDVVFAGIIIYASSWLLHHLIVVRGLPTGAQMRRLGTALTGSPLRRFLFSAALTAIAMALSVAFVDRPAAYFFHGQSETLRDVFRVVTLFGLSKWYLIGAAILWLALRTAARLKLFAGMARRLEAYSYLPLYFFTTLAVPGLVTDLVKVIAGRTRPTLLFSAHEFAFTFWATRADHWSFPSGHTANAVAIAFALTRIWPRFLPAWVVFAGLVALSRIVITAHYLSDVIMGAFIAVWVARYVTLVFRRSGVAIDDARAGVLPPRPRLPWRARFGLERHGQRS